MRFSKVLAVFTCVLAMAIMAAAGTNKFGVRDVSHVNFNEATRVGSVVLPAGEYNIRHTMEGENHVMVFQRAHSKDEFKVPCTLVPLSQKAGQDQKVYKLNAGSERTLQELIFRGDTAKHVF